MSDFDDLVGVAWSGLRARKIRTLLIMLGPIIGVAAMVSAVGLTESAKGALQQQLSQLGTNLIIAQAGGSFGSQNPTFPNDSVERVENVSTVEQRVGHHQPLRCHRPAHQGGQHVLRGLPGAGTRRGRRPAVGTRGPDGRAAGG